MKAKQGVLSRRNFMKSSAAVIAAGSLAGCSSGSNGDGTDIGSDSPNAPDLRAVRKVYSTCPVECLTHSLNCQLVGNEVIRVEPTTKPNDLYFTTACARGLSRMQFLTENRVATPMKRIKKGSETSPLGVVLKNNAVDEWMSISWEQALNEIGAKLNVLRRQNDPGIMVNVGSGNMGPVANSVISSFFTYAAPVRTGTVGNMCCEGVDDGMKVTYGNRAVDTRDTIRDSKCIICWGNNPSATSNTYWKFFIEAKLNGAKIITIDPRYSDTAEKSDQWISLMPGTDTLLAIGILRHIFKNDTTGGGTENWIDTDFLRYRTNAAYLIDISNVLDDDGNSVDLTDSTQKPWNKIYNLKYYEANGSYCVYDSAAGAVVSAEINKGREIDPSPVQQPDLYYDGTVNGTRVVTAYQLMRALYAGDSLSSAPSSSALSTDLTALWDPTYNDTYISSITGVSLQAIEDCASAYAGSGKKSMIIENMGGVTRTESGGHVCAMHCILSLITGNIGDAGNGVDDTSGYGSLEGFQTGDLAKINTSISFFTEPAPAQTIYSIPFSLLGSRSQKANNGQAEDIYLQSAYPSGTKDPQIKFWYIATLNLLTQYPNTDALKEALRATETVVVAKPTWNTDADYADYYLPVTTPFEYEDLGATNRNKYVQVMEAGVQPYGQSMSDMQIMRHLAKIVFSDDASVAQQFDHSDEEYVQGIVENTANNFAINGITNYETLKDEKTVRPLSIPGPWVPHRNHEFLGAQAIDSRAKIFITDWQYESVTPVLAAVAYPYPRISPNPARDLYRGPFPRYVPALESQLPLLDDFTDIPTEYAFYRSNYKLACVQMKVTRSVHASFTGLSWIREAFGEKGVVWINASDAAARGISNSETVTVKSHVGAVQRVAKVTDWIKQGVVAIENGWWDKYGPLSSSTVAAELPDPMGCGHTHNNTLVEVLKGGL